MFTQQIKNFIFVSYNCFARLSEGQIFLYLVCMHGCCRVQLFSTPWTVGHQVPLLMEFSSQQYRSTLPFPTPGDLPDPGIKPTSVASPALRGGFFTTSPSSKPFMLLINVKNLTQTPSMITGNRHLRRRMYTAEIPHLISTYSENAQIVPSPLLVLRRWQGAPCTHSLISQFPFTEWMRDNTQANTMCWGILVTQEK